jgi:putative hydrolase of the HAD superfamily
LRAVIFDLWDTLVLWDVPGSHVHYARMAAHAGVDVDRMTRAWQETHIERSTGPLEENVREVLALAGADPAHADALSEMRRVHTREALVAREGAIDTLEELSRRGLKVGLISVCSGDVEDVWDDTTLAPYFDDVVLSCTVGLRKPDPAIYRLSCERLGVEPGECLFVGDGANDELAGAERVGMKTACILRPGASEALWPEARNWEPTIRTLPEVLELAQQVD